MPPDFDLHRWFADDELEKCPSCGEPAGLRMTQTGSFFCFACGYVRASDAAGDDRVGNGDPAPG